MNNLAEIGWVAGIIDGEGTICSRRKSFGSCYVEVSMTTENSILRLKQITGLGNTRGPYFRKGKKPFWIWHVADSRELIRLYPAIYSFLSVEEKRLKILDSINTIAERVEGWENKFCKTRRELFSPSSSDNLYCSKKCLNKFHNDKRKERN